MSGNVRKNGRPTAVLALASGEGVAVAARKAGVAERTVRRWREEDGFRRVVAQAHAEMFARALGCLVEGAASGDAPATAGCSGPSSASRPRPRRRLASRPRRTC
jgi:hypothetical protein